MTPHPSARNKTNDEWSTSLFGPKLLTKPNTTGVPTASALSGKKLVALYFSASWCPPCKAFSPKLIEFYNSCKNDMEVIFISSDRDDASFNGYFEKMPWLALVPGYTSYEARDRQAKLAEMFKIKGIPTVIILDAKTGKFISDNARVEIMEATTNNNNNNNDDSKKALFQKYLNTEAVPIENAVLGAHNNEGGIAFKILMFFVKKPAYIFGLIYFAKRFLAYLERIGSEDDEGGKEL